MKVCKYRTKWAWGYGDYVFYIIPKNEDYLIKELGYSGYKEFLEEYPFSEVHNENNFSEHYRGIDYEIVEFSDLSNKEKDKIIKEVEDDIRMDQEKIRYNKKVLKQLNNEKEIK